MKRFDRKNYTLQTFFYTRGIDNNNKFIVLNYNFAILSNENVVLEN